MNNKVAVSHNKKWKAHLQYVFAKMMAFDAWNERRVIEEQFMKFFKIESLGSTATAPAFKIDQVY